MHTTRSMVRTLHWNPSSRAASTNLVVWMTGVIRLVVRDEQIGSDHTCMLAGKLVACHVQALPAHCLSSWHTDRYLKHSVKANMTST
jgi:hypothetical protein